MTIEFRAGSGNSRTFGQLRNLDNITSRGLRQGMFESGHGLIRRASTNIIRGPKTGRTYTIRTRSGRRRRHVASAPGETHANLTGAARRSLSFQLKGVRSLEFGYGVSSGKGSPEYVEFLEFGTRRMKARPTLQNALRDEQGNMVQHFQQNINRSFE